MARSSENERSTLVSAHWSPSQLMALQQQHAAAAPTFLSMAHTPTTMRWLGGSTVEAFGQPSRLRADLTEGSAVLAPTVCARLRCLTLAGCELDRTSVGLTHSPPPSSSGDVTVASWAGGAVELVRARGGGVAHMAAASSSDVASCAIVGSGDWECDRCKGSDAAPLPRSPLVSLLSTITLLLEG